MKAMSRIFLVTMALLVIITITNNYLAGVDAQASDNVTVEVNISQQAQLTVTPTNVSWFQISPGSNSPLRNLSIVNTGSTNLTNLYAYGSTLDDEATNPIDSGNATRHAASGFLFLKNETDSPFHVGRLEWNLSDVLDGEVVNLRANTFAFGHGWYRNSTGNFFLWKVENGTGGGSGPAACNATDTAFTIKNDPENNTALARDFTIGGNTVPSAAAANANWTTFAPTTGPLSGHCVAVYRDCTKIFIYKYDKRSILPTCTNSMFMRTAVLTPGDEILGVRVFASIPKGTPTGDTRTSTLTLTAT